MARGQAQGPGCGGGRLVATRHNQIARSAPLTLRDPCGCPSPDTVLHSDPFECTRGAPLQWARCPWDVFIVSNKFASYIRS